MKPKSKEWNEYELTKGLRCTSYFQRRRHFSCMECLQQRRKLQKVIFGEPLKLQFKRAWSHISMIDSYKVHLGRGMEFCQRTFQTQGNTAAVTNLDHLEKVTFNNKRNNKCLIKKGGKAEEKMGELSCWVSYWIWR